MTLGYLRSGVRRRGFPAEAVNLFAAKIGITMATAVLDPGPLEACCREVLNLTAPRAMVCLDPILVEIASLPEGFPQSYDVPDFPADESSKKHSIPFSRKIYIDRSDFMSTDSDRSFRRLTPKQPVGLKYAGLVLAVKDIEVDPATGLAKTLKCEVVAGGEKPRAFIHWVEASSAVPIEVHLINRLFKSKTPEQAVGGYIADLAPDSLVIMSSAVADVAVGHASINPDRPYDTRFQFERLGYFCADVPNAAGRRVFNRTVELKEDKGK